MEGDRGAGAPAAAVSVSPGGRPHWAERGPGRWALGAALPALVLAAWWLGARSGSAVVPGFGEVWDVLAHPLREPPDLQSPSLAFSVAITLVRFAVGFSLAVATAVPLGIAAARSPVLERLLQPMVELARPINPVVLLPLLTVLLGLTSPATHPLRPARRLAARGPRPAAPGDALHPLVRGVLPDLPRGAARRARDPRLLPGDPAPARGRPAARSCAGCCCRTRCRRSPTGCASRSA